jgi:Septum formation
MGSRIWLPATVAALFLTLPGCDSGADDSAAGSAEGGEPAIGTCWDVPAKDAMDPDYLFDNSPTVPCTEPHTTETAQVLQLSKPTIAEAKRQAGSCWDPVRVYLGVNPDHWVAWGWKVFLPSREQIADGASWMRCEAIFPVDWNFSSVRTTTGSAAEVAIDPPADLWACLAEHPKKSKQPFVPCDQPHQYEQIGTLAILNYLEEYPAPVELVVAARQQCAYALQGEVGELALTARWDPRSVLRDGAEIAGACFMSNKSGQPLPPRP